MAGILKGLSVERVERVENEVPWEADREQG